MLNLKSVIKTKEIEFLCHPELKGIIPEPIPAKKTLPDWYKKMPTRIQPGYEATIKRCPPVLDALTLDWMIPLVADLKVKSNHDGSQISFDSRSGLTLVQRHGMEQITSEKSPNPIMPAQPLKFINYWYIKVPKEYSILFVSPLNWEEKRFTCMPGMVNCDNYHNIVNFPFIWNEMNYTGIVKAGTPLVQAIPIKRDSLIKKSSCKPVNKKYMEKIDKTEKKQSIHMSYYRDFIWKPSKKENS